MARLISYSRRLEPGSFPLPPGRDLVLEGLRGFAALLVLYAHLTAPVTKLDPAYAPSPEWWRWEFATGAVLLFFVISGYVIGLTNRAPPGLAWWLAVVAAIPGTRIVWQTLAHGGWPEADIRPYAFCWVLGLLLLPWHPSRRVWAWLAPVGGISYALYAFAAPVQTWILHQSWLPSGSTASYSCRFGLVVLIAEGWMQPRLIARLRNRHP